MRQRNTNPCRTGNVSVVIYTGTNRTHIFFSLGSRSIAHPIFLCLSSFSNSKSWAHTHTHTPLPPQSLTAWLLVIFVWCGVIWYRVSVRLMKSKQKIHIQQWNRDYFCKFFYPPTPHIRYPKMHKSKMKSRNFNNFGVILHRNTAARNLLIIRSR